MQDKIISKDLTLKEAMANVNNKPAGFSFLVNNDKLIGMLTDGDIRRAILNGFGLGQKISELELPMCKYAFDTDSDEIKFSKMNGKIRVLPVVNKNMELVDYLQYDDRKHFPIAEPRLEGNELRYLTDALLSTWISSAGKYINTLEENFSNYIGMKNGVAVSNGTVAIHLALEALSIGKGDEVILPGFTFAATANAVLHANATPVIVDVEEDTWCIDPNEIEKAITPNTKAIIAVHIYGQPCDMEKISAIAKKHKLYLIEDAAEAHGAEYKGQKVGSFGDISTWSFFANKIITTGEGGMCLTNSDELTARMRQLRDHGMNKERRYWHDMVGYNYRMTNMQAAIGCAQLERINEIFEARDKLETEYLEIFNKYDFIQPQPVFDDRKKAVWLISATVKEAERTRLTELCKAKNVDVRNFFYPLCDMPPYIDFEFGDHKVSRKLSRIGLSFPTTKDIDLELLDSILQEFEDRNAK